MEKAGSGVVKKVFEVIKAFVDEKQEWGVRDLSRHLGMPKSTMHRLLTQLQDEGVLEFNHATGKYRIGVEMVRISSVVASNIDLIKIARPFMRKLVEKYNETICLVMYHKQTKKIAFVEKMQGSQPLQYVIHLGELQPIPYGSTGKSILAFLNPEEIEQILSDEGFAGEKLEEVRRELMTIRKNGYAITQNQRIEGARGIGAPIFNAAGEPLASLVYTVPIARFREEQKDDIVADITAAAGQISNILGYQRTGEKQA